jgi:3-oxoacyl-[acyl-carrier-protein] synthase II
MTRRVVITGSGMVTPLGSDTGEVWRQIGAGASALRAVTSFDASSAGECRGGEVPPFDARPWFKMPKALKLTDRRTRMAVAAAGMAVASASLSLTDEQQDGIGVVIGSSGSDIQVEDLARAIGEDHEGRAARDIPWFAERILSGLNPLWLLVNLPNMVSAHVAIQLGFRGPDSTIMTDWIAGTQAIGEAFRWIAAGDADVVLAGGADAGVLPFVYGSYAQAGIFGQDCGGGRTFVPADAAAMFVLEEREHALSRGATILGELRGYAAVAPYGDGVTAVSEAMRRALDDAGWRASDLRAICRAAVFHPPAWQGESEAIEATAAGCPTLEFRSALGHPLAASGGVDLALTLTCPEVRSGAVLLNSIGFSGQAATLAVEVHGEVA